MDTCPTCEHELEWYDYIEIITGNYSEIIGEIYICPTCYKYYNKYYGEDILIETKN